MATRSLSLDCDSRFYSRSYIRARRRAAKGCTALKYGTVVGQGDPAASVRPRKQVGQEDIEHEAVGQVTRT